MTTGEGLTQRRMRRTRQAIADTARRLFLERGFDRVTVAEVAAAAEVAEKTVYNYFPTKVDLVFDADDSVLEQLVAAVRGRGAGQSALAAVRACLARVSSELGEGAPRAQQAAFRAMVADSPTLQVHQRAMAARYEHALAEVLAEETGVDPGSAEPFLVAVGLVGALRAGHHTAVRSGGRAAATKRALDLLEAGLADYARKPEPDTTPTADTPGRNPS